MKIGMGKGREPRGNSKIARFFYFTACALLFALCFSAEAQQPARMPRIGFITVSGNPKNPGVLNEAFRQGLRELGYVEGKNIRIEYRYTAGEPERVPESVAEFVQLKVDALVINSSA